MRIVFHPEGCRISNVALIGSKPPPQMNQECVAGWALPRPTGNTLFYSFLGRGGEEEKDV